MIPNAEIDPEIEKRYAAHLAATFGARIEPKGESEIMEAAGVALRALGLPIGDRWMTHVVTTMGRRIFIPWTPGDRTPGGWDPWERFAVLAHECQHVVQTDREGIEKGLGYLISTAKRGHVEADALTTSAELHFWRYGEIASWWPRVRSEGLAAYGCSPADVVHVHTHLISAAATIRRGGVITSAGLAARQWLDQHAPELRARA